MIVAPDFVRSCSGHSGVDATPVIQILAWVGLLQAIQTLNGEVLLALNQAGTLFRFTAFWFVATVAAFAVGIHWGIVGVAVCYAIVTTLLEPLRAYLTTRALGIPLWRFVRSLGGVAQGTAVMVAALLPTRAALQTLGLPAGGPACDSCGTRHLRLHWRLPLACARAQAGDPACHRPAASHRGLAVRLAGGAERCPNGRGRAVTPYLA